MLINFEGVDSSGKTTQASLLFAVLRSMGIEAAYVKVPGANAVSRKMYDVIRNSDLDKDTEVKLFLAAIANIDFEIVQPKRRNQVVILDRWFYSTLAYQGYGYGYGRKEIWRIVDHYRISEPDLNFFMRIDLPGDKIKERIAEHRLRPDKFETQSSEFYENVQDGFGIELPVETTVIVPTLNSVIDNFNTVYDAVNKASKSAMPVNKRPTVEQLQAMIEKVKGS